MPTLTNKETFERFAQEHFPGKITKWAQSYCFIQAGTCLGSNLHYEFHKGRVQLHIEGDNYRPVREWLKVHLKDSEIKPVHWGRKDCSWVLDRDIFYEQELYNAFLAIRDKIEPAILDFESQATTEKKTTIPCADKANSRDAMDTDEVQSTMALNDVDEHIEEVELDSSKTLRELFDRNKFHLRIPDYQRTYCWEERNVYRLWTDISELTEVKPYHLGNIILYRQNQNDAWDIVDGQQRLVTLTLILLALGEEESCLSLADAVFESDEAVAYIAYNKYLINGYISTLSDSRRKEIIRLMYDKLQFSVLKLTGGSLDLAYTFFSNQNTKGVPLSDYNLLKAHHLRYIGEEKQACHIASRWDMLVGAGYESESDMKITLGLYLYRLRKWMKKRIWNENAPYRVRDEFKAAPVLQEVPPFGEKFDFYESIQGGAHFFAYSEHFMRQFKMYQSTDEHKALVNNFSGESHWKYRDVIDSMLFGYYLKFGSQYLSEALLCIAGRISFHRYSNGRVRLDSILSYANDSEIVLMLNQATSPTFFMAELKDSISRQEYIKDDALGPIQKRYRKHFETMYKSVLNGCTVDSIKNIRL